MDNRRTSSRSGAIQRFFSVTIATLSLLFLACNTPFLANHSSKSGSSDAAVSFTVTFDSQGATAPASPAAKTVTSPGSKVDALPTEPAKTDYFFGGWWTSPNGGGAQFTAASTVTANITVYAKWTANPVYTLSFDSQGGSVEAGQKVEEGHLATAPADPTKTGYLFGGWCKDAAGSSAWNFSTDTVSADTTVYAKWNSYTYTVTYDSQGADVEASPVATTVSSPATTVAALPSPPTKSGSNFAGWWTQAGGAGTQFTASSLVDTSLTVYADWSTSAVYTLSFDSQGGSAVASELVVSGQTAIEPTAPSKTGYQFAGWYKESSLTTAWSFSRDTVASSTTLYAKWTAATYAIAYYLNGGVNSPGAPTQYTIETPTFTLQSATRTGYSFAGWYSDSGLTTQVSQIALGSSGNKSLYAKWSPIAYTISYNLDGGVNDASNPDTYTIESGAIVLQPATKPGCTFTGWYSDSGLGSPVSQIASGSTGNLSLYAGWTTGYTVSFDSQGATVAAVPVSMTVVYPATTVGSLPSNPSKTGYAFGGWWTGANGSGSQFTASTTVAGPLVVYAKWTPISYPITYNLNGGANSPSNPSSYTIASPTIALQAPAQTGYTFVGWYADSGFTTQVTQIVQGSMGAVTLYAQWWSATSAQVATPAFSPAAGAYGSDQSVTISCATSGATIYYTTDGATWNIYSGPIAVQGNGTDELITAYATATGLTDSGVAGAEYIINTQVAVPVVSITSGTYSSDPTLSITCATAGATIYYTTDGSVPTTSSTLYTGPISLSSTQSLDIRAIAVKDGMISSSVDAGTYTIDPTRVSTPQFSPAGGSFSSPQSVAIGSWTSGATIRYTTDGSTPTETYGVIYYGPISLGSACTLKAIAYMPGMSDSTVQTQSYSFPAPVLPSNFNITATGQFKKISITWTTIPGATSYNLYWIKGTTVTKSTGTKASNVSSGYVILNLTNGWNYAFIVTGVNANGEGAPSAVAVTQPHS